MKLKEVGEDNNVLLIELNEDNLDASNAREFRDAVQLMMRDRTRVVLDMTGVRFVDSSGLGALISCLRLLNGRAGDFKLCAMSKPVRAHRPGFQYPHYARRGSQVFCLTHELGDSGSRSGKHDAAFCECLGAAFGAGSAGLLWPVLCPAGRGGTGIRSGQGGQGAARLHLA